MWLHRIATRFKSPTPVLAEGLVPKILLPRSGTYDSSAGFFKFLPYNFRHVSVAVWDEWLNASMTPVRSQSSDSGSSSILPRYARSTVQSRPHLGPYAGHIPGRVIDRPRYLKSRFLLLSQPIHLIANPCHIIHSSHPTMHVYSYIVPGRNDLAMLFLGRVPIWANVCRSTLKNREIRGCLPRIVASELLRATCPWRTLALCHYHTRSTVYGSPRSDPRQTHDRCQR